MITPYYSDDTVELYHGDMREVLPELGQFDACVADPPYAETSLPWDRWPDGWPNLIGAHTNSLWCFGSVSMFIARAQEFASWRMSQDVVWEKHNGSGFQNDRFRRVHEHAVHWYRGRWDGLHHQVPRVPATYDPKRPKGSALRSEATQAPHARHIGPRNAVDDHTRLTRSVIYAKSMQRRAIHPTEKPSEILAPLIEYAVPVGGLVLDPFAGSGSTLLTARQLGRRAVGVEASEEYCEKAAARLAVPDLFGGVA